jgi:hypothetical protein
MITLPSKRSIQMQTKDFSSSQRVHTFVMGLNLNEMMKADSRDKNCGT